MYFIKLLIIAMFCEMMTCLGISDKEPVEPAVKVIQITHVDTTKALEASLKSESPGAMPIQISLP